MNSVSLKLKSYAKAREKAYRIKGVLDRERAMAIQNIIRVADHFREARQNGWIGQIKKDILAILPGEDSKFKKQRAVIIQIIKQNIL